MFDYLLEKFESAGCFEEIKEYKKMSYEDVKKDIESMFGKCAFNSTDIESPIVWVRPWLTEDEYRLICYGES
ncbi:hypothetical protein D7X33_25515 [Butyricicoccus sp. 1XD8-22]|nr:hypothetical protein D7X33_25515 [Butyricicoccus sp. 1XD8-22]